MSSIRQTNHQEIYARLVLFALVVVGVESLRQRISPRFAILLIAYLLVIVGLYVGRRWLSAPLHVFTGLGVDVAAVTFLLFVTGSSRLPLWLLYLLPLIVTARAGRIPLAVATSLSVASLFVAQGITAGLTMTTVGWPVLALIGIAFALDLTAEAINADGRVLGAITNAREISAIREGLRRAKILDQAAARLMGTFDEAIVRDVVVEAASAALDREVSLVDHATLPESADNASSASTVSYGLAVRPIADHLVLVDAGDSRLTAADRAWLDELTQLAREALGRCTEYARLRRDEQALRTILDSLPAPVAVWNRDGQYLVSNVAYRALALESPPTTGLSTDRVREEECVVGDPRRTFVVTTVPLHEDQKVIALFREVTREREALRAKDELISVIGHELRNPLASIHGYSQVMARQLGVVQDQVNRLNHMIADFMIAARLEGGQLPIKREETDLVTLAKAAADRFRGASPDRSLRLDLPDRALVEGDPDRLSQVLDNLLNNAEKYSPADQVIALQIQRHPDEGEFLLSVTDHGIGIASEHLPHLFDRFYRAPSTETQQVKGLGLGLSIVQDLVAAHGGRVWVESAGEGTGSTFWVSLRATTRPSESQSLGEANGDGRSLS